MTIKLKKNATEREKERIISILKENGFDSITVAGKTATIICVIGEETTKLELLKNLESYPGVESVTPVNDPYRLVSRRLHPEYNGKTKVINVSGIEVGKKPIIIAGPCTLYSLEQALTVGKAVKEAGADIFRGGAFKPRTSPYDFQGLGKKGLKILAEVREKTGLPVVTEVMDVRDIKMVSEYADILQIGARNMQNYTLLKEAGKQEKPILLKRHPYSSLREWLCAAEYIAVEGNYNIILCERGIRTALNGEYDRNTLDLNVISAVKEKTFLPVIADPSHGTGKRSIVCKASKAAIDVGADGIMVEVMRDDEEPLIECEKRKITYCDYNQSISISEFKDLMRWIGKKQ